MQSTSSRTTVVVIMIVDLINSVLALNGLRQRILTIKELRIKTRRFDLVKAASSLCQNSTIFERQERKGVQLRSCMSYKVSPSTRGILDRLSEYPGYQPQTKSSFSFASGRLFSQQNTIFESRKTRWRCLTRQCRAIQPIIVKTVAQNKLIRIKQADSIREQQRSDLREALAVLFTSECLVLSEYLESVPILYANYIKIMVYLPSARYHTEMEGINRDNVSSMVGANLAYALLEFLSFVIMVIFVNRSCGMHHLAFVLETHMPLIQDKLLAWTLLTLASRVVHFGTCTEIYPTDPIKPNKLLQAWTSRSSSPGYSAVQMCTKHARQHKKRLNLRSVLKKRARNVRNS
ncbi:unnamed protein product [Phytophthora lilii]|uniref:Unnamed protein product n=1 Tax=Phytophthora lilii TaxID=2077276 RepID=A0A9W6TSB0_9STRA|nr:unnamed protein product [Phytophthora lilii]